jgi:hypothetical protein
MVGGKQTTLVSKVGGKQTTLDSKAERKQTILVLNLEKAGIGPADNTRLKVRGKAAKAVLKI